MKWHYVLSFTMLLIFSTISLCNSKEQRGLVINSSRPYIDIAFQGVGKRYPIFPDESDQGLWLTLRNNCAYRIQVRTLTLPNKNQGVLLAHEVISAPKSLFATPPPPGVAPEASRLSEPTNYAGVGHIVNNQEVPPSGEISFSVPLDHVTRDRSIRLEVELEIPRPKSGHQPRIFVEFYWTDLPVDAQRLSDQILSQAPR